MANNSLKKIPEDILSNWSEISVLANLSYAPGLNLCLTGVSDDSRVQLFLIPHHSILQQLLDLATEVVGAVGLSGRHGLLLKCEWLGIEALTVQVLHCCA